MAEWSIAAVLKTVEPRGSRGSNPCLSAEPTGQKRTVRGQKPTNQRFVGFCPLTLLFCSVGSAERQGIEPKHLTAYKSAFYFPKFQIGNETVTIFAGLFVRLCPLFVCLSHGFKDTTHFLITQISEYKCFSLGARCKLYI